MIRRTPIWLLTLAVVSLTNWTNGYPLSSRVWGDERDERWLNRTFMPKAEAKFEVDGQITPHSPPLPLVVRAVDGEWLVVGTASVRKTDVIAVKGARAYYDGYLREHPESAWALAHRGLVWGHEEELERAEKDLNAALQIDPRSALAYNLRGYVRWSLDQNDPALDDFAKAIEIAPDYPDAYFNRGNLYSEIEDNERAKADYDAAIRLSPKFSDAYSNRGLVDIELGDHDRAIKDFDAATRLNPYDAEAFANRGLVRAACPEERLRNGTLAVQDAQRACELTDYRDADSLGVLAAAYAESGKFTEAIRWQLQAISRADASSREFHFDQLRSYREKKPLRY